MDAGTVIDIIAMIDSQLAFYARTTGEDIAYVESKEIGLVALREHLQGYIEGLLNAEENKTYEG